MNQKMPALFLSAFYSVRTNLMTIKLEHRPRRVINDNQSVVEEPTETVAVFQASIYDTKVNATFNTQNMQLVRALTDYFTYEVLVDDTINEFVEAVSFKFHDNEVNKNAFNPLENEDEQYGLVTHYRDFEEIDDEEFAKFA